MHTYDGDIDEILITEDAIAARIRELADEISADYADREPMLVGILKGAAIVMSDLARALSRLTTPGDSGSHGTVDLPDSLNPRVLGRLAAVLAEPQRTDEVAVEAVEQDDDHVLRHDGHGEGLHLVGSAAWHHRASGSTGSLVHRAPPSCCSCVTASRPRSRRASRSR